MATQRFVKIFIPNLGGRFPPIHFDEDKYFSNGLKLNHQQLVSNLAIYGHRGTWTFCPPSPPFRGFDANDQEIQAAWMWKGMNFSACCEVTVTHKSPQKKKVHRKFPASTESRVFFWFWGEDGGPNNLADSFFFVRGNFGGPESKRSSLRTNRSPRLNHGVLWATGQMLYQIIQCQEEFSINTYINIFTFHTYIYVTYT